MTVNILFDSSGIFRLTQGSLVSILIQLQFNLTFHLGSSGASYLYFLTYNTYRESILIVTKVPSWVFSKNIHCLDAVLSLNVLDQFCSSFHKTRNLGHNRCMDSFFTCLSTQIESRHESFWLFKMKLLFQPKTST